MEDKEKHVEDRGPGAHAGPGGRDGSVLVAGIYLSDQANNIEHIAGRLGESAKWDVRQRWASIGVKGGHPSLGDATALSIAEGEPKFVLLNRLLAGEDLGKYRFVIISDDDISLPPDFLDEYLDLVVKHDFALAQPARTHASYIDHHFVEQLDGLEARRTRYVEIGPLFSVRSDAFGAVFPFDESSYMGWGFDFTWPCAIEEMGLRMGIVDATPVEHSMRKPVAYYKHEDARKSMEDYLAGRPHLSRDEAFRILESYA